MGGQKNTQFVWTPTKRRGPIAAEFSTPGPAAINLPPTFGSKVTVTKSRSPAFTISGRHESRSSTASPGPGQYNINGLTYKGKDEPHAPSMHIRPKDPKPFVTPAPGDYCPEKSKKVLDPSPKFSFGVKTENGPASDVPAPNSYTIASLIGTGKTGGPHQSSPSFTMSARPRELEDKMKIPGPGSYNEAFVDKYKTAKSPAFSMGQRTNIPSDHTQKPGPGAHSPEKCMRNNGFKFTMTGRLKEPKKFEVPGPASYEIPNMDAYLERMPIFTISPRINLPKDDNQKPSPNTYSPEKCMLDASPKWTIAGRLKEMRVSDVPGPGTYESGDLNAIYERQPVFTLRPKTELPTDKSPKPSPNSYYPEKCMQESTPKWTMAPRTELPTDKSPKPSPNTYCPEKCMQDSTPKWTMAPRTELPTDKSPKPSPNAYCPEKYVAEFTPQWTMAPRTELPSDKSPKPSPNAYSPEKYNAEEGPKWTMALRTEIPCDKSPKPAPNAYSPDEAAMAHHNPEFSFGIKHSPYLGKLRDQ
ncbi:UNVERIFIED_CONTAM: hypothetical protein RMT77_013761 [Armadillidium vulgare]